MDEALKRITGLAWRSVPAMEANTAILRARRATAAGEDAARFGELETAEEGESVQDDEDAPMARAYEVALPEGATLETFARDQLPKLVYHLESVGAHLPRPAGVVICLFAGDRLHFLQATELISAVCKELGVGWENLVERFGTHELRTAIRADSTEAKSTGAQRAADAPRPALMLGLPPTRDDRKG